MIPHLYKGYTVLKELDIQTVLAHIPLEPNEDLRVEIEGYLVKVASPRLVMYKTKGLKCVQCNCRGVVWRIETNHGNKPHLNLYASDGRMLTKDHIIPKSKGGLNCLSNYQPMCDRCNMKKGNKDV